MEYCKGLLKYCISHQTYQCYWCVTPKSVTLSQQALERLLSLVLLLSHTVGI